MTGGGRDRSEAQVPGRMGGSGSLNGLKRERAVLTREHILALIYLDASSFGRLKCGA